MALNELNSKGRLADTYKQFQLDVSRKKSAALTTSTNDDEFVLSEELSLCKTLTSWATTR